MSSCSDFETEESGSGSEEADVTREWNGYCQACGDQFGDSDAPRVRCSGCPCQYHFNCLSQRQRPQRTGLRWLCPQCERLALLGRGIDAILACRGSGAGREYHVKFKGRSLLHAEWVRIAELEQAGSRFRGVAARLKHFDSKRTQGLHTQVDDELVDGIKPAWLEVERVIAERPISSLRNGGGAAGDGAAPAGAEAAAATQGAPETATATASEFSAADALPAGVQYLCKWKELPYSECTWEEGADIAAYHHLIRQYRQRLPIAEVDLEQKLAWVVGDSQQQREQQQQQQQPNLGPPHDGPDQQAGAEAMPQQGASQAGSQRRFSDTPAFLQGRLHPYQLEGLNWMYQGWQSGTNLILADEMGLGKTVQAIAFLAALSHERAGSCRAAGTPLRPHLVIVPLSTLPNWEREFARFAAQLNVVTLAGNAEARGTVKEYEMFGHGLGEPTIRAGGRRRELLQRAVLFHVLLTSYEIAVNEAEDLGKLEWEALVVDEGHRLKNKEARLFRALHGLRCQHRVLLTGTPLQNNISEIFCMLLFLGSEGFQDLDALEQEFEAVREEDQVARLHSLLRPHLLRRTKADVLRQLPPKKEQIMAVELSASQKLAYREILAGSYESLTQGGVSKLRNVMMELRKAVQHVYLLQFPPEPRPMGQAWLDLLLQGSGKLALLDRMLERLKAGGHRVLIYSQFVLLLDVLEWYCEARAHTHLRLDGSVGTAERQRRIDAYNSKPHRHFIFLLSTRAGGLGINLSTADTVFIFDSDHNPQADIQAQARAHRLGQQNGVMVFRFVARSTLEERMVQRAKSKLVLEHVVVRRLKRKAGAGGKADGQAEGALDKRELQDLIKFGAAELFAEEMMETGGVEAGGAEAGAGADARAASKERPMPAVVREQQAGRTGGTDGKAVVWTDEELDALLDRTNLTSPGVADEEARSGILDGFQVAHFKLQERPGLEAAADAAARWQLQGGTAEEGADVADGGFGSGDLQASKACWSELLQGRQGTALQAEADELFGKGKRQRQKLAEPGYAAELDEWLARQGSGDDSRRSSSSRSSSGSDYALGSEEEQEQRREEELEAQVLSQAQFVPEERQMRKLPSWMMMVRASEQQQAAAGQPAAAGQQLPMQLAVQQQQKQQDREQQQTQQTQQSQQGEVLVTDQQQRGQQVLAGDAPPVAGRRKRRRRSAVQMAESRGDFSGAMRLSAAKDWVILWPRIYGTGDNMRVWGFSAPQRRWFLALVMERGVPFQEGSFDWQPMIRLLNSKGADEIAKYGDLLMEQVAAAAAAAEAADSAAPAPAAEPDLLPALLGDVEVSDVLARLGMLHLLRTTWEQLTAVYNQPTADNRPGPPLPCVRNLQRDGLRRGLHAWTMAHDIALIKGSVLYGLRWDDVLADKSLGLVTPLLHELGLSHLTVEQLLHNGKTTSQQHVWLEARTIRLAAALAEDPDASDPPLLSSTTHVQPVPAPQQNPAAGSHPRQQQQQQSQQKQVLQQEAQQQQQQQRQWEVSDVLVQQVPAPLLLHQQQQAQQQNQQRQREREVSDVLVQQVPAPLLLHQQQQVRQYQQQSQQQVQQLQVQQLQQQVQQPQVQHSLLQVQQPQVQQSQQQVQQLQVQQSQQQLQQPQVQQSLLQVQQPQVQQSQQQVQQLQVQQAQLQAQQPQVQQSLLRAQQPQVQQAQQQARQQQAQQSQQLQAQQSQQQVQQPQVQQAQQLLPEALLPTECVVALANRIALLPGLTSMSIQARQHMIYTNRRMFGHAAAINSASQAMHQALCTEPQAVDTLAAGESFREHLRNINADSERLVKLIRVELLQLAAADEARQKRLQQMQEGQQARQHLEQQPHGAKPQQQSVLTPVQQTVQQPEQQHSVPPAVTQPVQQQQQAALSAVQQPVQQHSLPPAVTQPVQRQHQAALLAVQQPVQQHSLPPAVTQPVQQQQQAALLAVQQPVQQHSVPPAVTQPVQRQQQAALLAVQQPVQQHSVPPAVTQPVQRQQQAALLAVQQPVQQHSLPPAVTQPVQRQHQAALLAVQQPVQQHSVPPAVTQPVQRQQQAALLAVQQPVQQHSLPPAVTQPVQRQQQAALLAVQQPVQQHSVPPAVTQPVQRQHQAALLAVQQPVQQHSVPPTVTQPVQRQHQAALLAVQQPVQQHSVPPAVTQPVQQQQQAALSTVQQPVQQPVVQQLVQQQGLVGGTPPRKGGLQFRAGASDSGAGAEPAAQRQQAEQVQQERDEAEPMTVAPTDGTDACACFANVP
ncbi:hypothetical protein D9Q98_008533 [Chlorella vulgaris]|uniref:CHD3-type chromatin-remodeling factor PICKLE n=1 Tax=Chlorella vulgaris TaxID=3077 RepID=A0A9D4TI50_CHLVU|nr:hypothetical protein D9Q98_008533 [Chlorella vulgaris]